MLAINLLHRLTYVSTIAKDLDPAEIPALVTAAAEKNARLQITGILLFNGLNFLQTLEGPHSNVIKLFSQISHDDRHNGVVCVQSDTPERRAFESWSMAYTTVGRAGGSPDALAANGFAWADGRPSLPAHLKSLFLAFNSLGKSVAIAGS